MAQRRAALSGVAMNQMWGRGVLHGLGLGSREPNIIRPKYEDDGDHCGDGIAL
tara:strand:+ start:889 stop:1047 length:159 start_codon:yes stop_codon:yes gene_type:complete